MHEPSAVMVRFWSNARGSRVKETITPLDQPAKAPARGYTCIDAYEYASEDEYREEVAALFSEFQRYG